MQAEEFLIFFFLHNGPRPSFCRHLYAAWICGLFLICPPPVVTRKSNFTLDYFVLVKCDRLPCANVSLTIGSIPRGRSIAQRRTHNNNRANFSKKVWIQLHSCQENVWSFSCRCPVEKHPIRYETRRQTAAGEELASTKYGNWQQLGMRESPYHLICWASEPEREREKSCAHIITTAAALHAWHQPKILKVSSYYLEGFWY